MTDEVVRLKTFHHIEHLYVAVCRAKSQEPTRGIKAHLETHLVWRSKTLKYGRLSFSEIVNLDHVIFVCCCYILFVGTDCEGEQILILFMERLNKFSRTEVHSCYLEIVHGPAARAVF